MVLDLVRRLRDRGLAVMVISHNLNDVFAVADRIAVLYLGQDGGAGQDVDLRPAERRRVHDHGGPGRDDSSGHAERREESAMATADPGSGSGGAPSHPRSKSRSSRVRPDRGARTSRRALVPPEVVAQTMGEYVRGPVLRIRGGESGMLPVILGLIVIVIVFQVISPHHVFLSAGNIVNLFQQSAVFMVLAMAETFALLLGEIDLSLGYVGAVGGAIAVQLVQPATTNWPWWAAIVVALIGVRAHRRRSRAR